jgi:TolA-binding protein
MTENSGHSAGDEPVPTQPQEPQPPAEPTAATEQSPPTGTPFSGGTEPTQSVLPPSPPPSPEATQPSASADVTQQVTVSGSQPPPADATQPASVPTGQPVQQPTTPGPQPAYPQQAYPQQGYPQGGYQTPAPGVPVAQLPVSPLPPGADPATQPIPVQYWQPKPPKPPKPRPTNPKSTAGAILLNVTGLGIGYAYLGRWIRFVAALLIVSGLVLLAFANDASSSPWLWRLLTIGWVAVLALDAWLIARRHPEPTGAPQWLPIGASVVTIAAIIAGYVFYGALGRDTFEEGLTEQARANCQRSIDKFDEVTGIYELTLSENVRDAPQERQLCVDFMAASSALDDKKLAEAEKLYLKFRKTYPKSPLDKLAVEDLGTTYYAQVEKQLPNAATDYPAIIDKLLMIRRDYGKTSAAKKVPDAIDDTYEKATTAFAEGRFCDALEPLAYFAGQDAKLLGDVVSTAAANHNTALYKCGIGKYTSGDCAGAIDPLQTFLDAVPSDGARPQAYSALIAAQVCDASGFATPLPAPHSGDAVGAIPVTFYNDSSEPAHVLLAGPTAHEFTINPCGTCVEAYPPGGGVGACPVPEALPSYTVYLPAAPYNALLENSVAGGESHVQSFTPDPNIYYCAYNEQPF